MGHRVQNIEEEQNETKKKTKREAKTKNGIKKTIPWACQGSSPASPSTGNSICRQSQTHQTDTGSSTTQ
jgi:hypothetical protein